MEWPSVSTDWYWYFSRWYVGLWNATAYTNWIPFNKVKEICRSPKRRPSTTWNAVILLSASLWTRTAVPRTNHPRAIFHNRSGRKSHGGLRTDRQQQLYYTHWRKESWELGCFFIPVIIFRFLFVFAYIHKKRKSFTHLAYLFLFFPTWSPSSLLRCIFFRQTYLPLVSSLFLLVAFSVRIFACNWYCGWHIKA